jgi:hypothetical protein
VAELADAPDLGSGAERRGGSSPPSRISPVSWAGEGDVVKRRCAPRFRSFRSRLTSLLFDVVPRGRNSQVPLAFFWVVNYKTEAPRKFLAPGRTPSVETHPSNSAIGSAQMDGRTAELQGASKALAGKDAQGRAAFMR